MRFNEFKQQLSAGDTLSAGEDLVRPSQVIVQKRDSLYKIASKYKISLADLIAANPQIANPDMIHPGDTIKLPSEKPVAPEIARGRPTMKDDPRLKPDAETPAKPPADKPDVQGGSGRGKINPEPIGKGTYQIPDPSTAWHVFNFFKKNGFNDVQAAAFVGNAYHESGGLNTSALGDYDKLTGKIPTSAGIFQWRLTRWAGLRKFAGPKSWKNLDVQLEWAMHELNGSYKGVVSSLNQGKGKTDIAVATKIIMDKYENPNAASAHYDNRLGWAKTVLDAFGTKQPNTPA